MCQNDKSYFKGKNAISPFHNQHSVFSFLNSYKMNFAWHVKITLVFALNVLYTIMDNTVLSIFIHSLHTLLAVFSE